MKRFFALMLALCLMAAAAGLGETAPMPDAEAAGTEKDAGETVPMGEETASDSEDPGETPEEEALEEEELEARTLQYGDEGDDVLELQIRLQELKYYTGNLSGRYREGTREAVRSFQEDYGLEKNGIADQETQARIFSAKYRPLRHGASGDEVRDLQNRLTALG